MAHARLDRLGLHLNPASTSRSARKLRVGIIGLGDISEKSFAPSVLESPLAELVAVCRRNVSEAQKFAARWSEKQGGEPIAAYGSAAELVADPRVDAVIVATMTDTHDADEARRMVAAARNAGVSLSVAYRRRLFPQVVEALRLIEAGRIGKVVCVRTHYSGNMEIASGAWRGDPEIGGALMEMASHRLAVLLDFGGEVESLSAMIDTVRTDRGWTVDDTDAMVVRFKSGLIGVHSTILTSPPRHDFVQIDGTEGRIIVENLEYFSDSLVIETSGPPGPNGDLVNRETVTVPCASKLLTLLY
jgi:predicted dehydrogenase